MSASNLRILTAGGLSISRVYRSMSFAQLCGLSGSALYCCKRELLGASSGSQTS